MREREREGERGRGRERERERERLLIHEEKQYENVQSFPITRL